MPPTVVPATPRTIAIASGKGGVGKTWFAITLAHALARRNRRVLLVDADLGLANIDVQLGIAPRLGIADLLAGTPLPQVAHRVADGGFDLLAGSSGSGALAALPAPAIDRLLEALAAATAYDHVLLDLGAGLDGTVRRMAAWAETLLVLATGEPTSITDAYATLKLHYAGQGPGADARLVVNAAPSTAAADRTAATIARACTAFLGTAPALLGTVRRDHHVPDAIRRQTLLLTRSPTCPAAEDVGRIARVI